jgi:two-component system, NarL family, nitrate/nitrite response regulator NarL
MARRAGPYGEPGRAVCRTTRPLASAPAGSPTAGLAIFSIVKPADGATRVVLVDDHQFFRDGLRTMLAAQNIAVVGEAADGARAAALVRELAPDATVIDLKMPNASGIEAIKAIVADDPGARILVLTVSADQHDAIEAFAAGACGYLVKDTHPDELAGAICLVANGHAVLSSKLAHTLACSYERSQAIAAVAADGAPALTAREREVLRLIVAGADNAAIGRQLSISKHTVKQHVTNLFEKLEVSSRVQAAVYAVRHDLV